MKRLTADCVRDCLENRVPSKVIAQRHQISIETINRIRRGESHGDVFPELPRWGSRSCRQCIHWCGGCGYGIPEVRREGPLFARFCSTFQEEDDDS